MSHYLNPQENPFYLTNDKRPSSKKKPSSKQKMGEKQQQQPKRGGVQRKLHSRQLYGVSKFSQVKEIETVVVKTSTTKRERESSPKDHKNARTSRRMTYKAGKKHDIRKW